MRRADRLFRGTLLAVLNLSVTVKPRLLGASGAIWALMPAGRGWGKLCSVIKLFFVHRLFSYTLLIILCSF